MKFVFFAQVKELGAALYNCPCAGEDLFKIFDVKCDFPDPERPAISKREVPENKFKSHSSKVIISCIMIFAFIRTYNYRLRSCQYCNAIYSIPKSLSIII